jgi:hypothetical protein
MKKKSNLIKILNNFKKTTPLKKLNEFVYSDIIKINQPKILEFGVDKGISTSFFLNICEKNKGNLTSVDIINYNNILHNKRWNFINTHDSNYKTILKKNHSTFDVIFLDTIHTAKHIEKIFYIYFSKLKINGYFLIDDIFWLPYCKGLWRDNFWIETNNRESFEKLISIYNANQKNMEISFLMKDSGLAKIRKISNNKLAKPIKLTNRTSGLKYFIKNLFFKN